MFRQKPFEFFKIINIAEIKLWCKHDTKLIEFLNLFLKQMLLKSTTDDNHIVHISKCGSNFLFQV